MSWTVVAKKDFRDALRSRMLWGLTVLFVLFMAGIAYAYTLFANQAPTGDPTVDSLGLVAFLSSPVSLLVPITGLVVGHKAIAGEVESGSAKLLLSLPHSRRDAVLGKVVGRTAVLSLSIVVGVLAGILVTLALYDTVDLGALAIFGVLSLVLGAVYTSIGVGISATTRDGGRATIAAAGFFLVIEVIWDFVPWAVNYLLNGSFIPTGTPPVWFAFLGRIAPSSAYSYALNTYIPEAGLTGGMRLPDSILLSGGAALVILLAWLVLTPLVGYLRFNARDL